MKTIYTGLRPYYVDKYNCDNLYKWQCWEKKSPAGTYHPVCSPAGTYHTVYQMRADQFHRLEQHITLSNNSVMAQFFSRVYCYLKMISPVV